MASLPVYIISVTLLFLGRGENPGNQQGVVLPSQNKLAATNLDSRKLDIDRPSPDQHIPTIFLASPNTRIEKVNQYWMNSAWINSSQEIIINNASGVEIEKNTFYWDETTSVWLPSSRYTTSYDTLGYRQCVLRQSRNDSVWVISSRDSFSYDARHNCIKKQTQNYYGSGWRNRGRVEYVYDYRNNLIDQIQTYWNDITWTKRSRDIWVYDKDNLLIELARMKVMAGEFDLTSKYEYHHNAEGEVSLRYYFKRIRDKAVWLLTSKVEYCYDGKGNMYYSRQYSLHDTGWFFYSEVFEEYDKYNRVVKHLLRYPSDTTDEYEILQSYRYDRAGRLEEYCSTTLMDSAIVSGNRDLYTYNPLGIAEEVQTTASQFQLYENYPNPFNSATTLNYRLTASSLVSLKVFDILGKEVAVLKEEFETAGIKTVTWNSSDLPSGIYIVRLVAGKKSQSRKIILLK